MNFSKFVIIFSHVPVVITTVYALFIYKSLRKELKVFSVFLFLSAVIQLISLAFWFNKQNNLPLLHFYVAGGFACLAWFYSVVLHGFVSRRILWIATALFLVFTVCNSLFVQKIDTFNSYALTIECILIVILSLSTYMLFLDAAAAERVKDILKGLNWINSGLFVYYSSTLIIFYSGQIMLSFSLSANRYTWMLHSFFSVIMYTCFFVGLWKRSVR